jgi:type IX secretion system PorP/SprF family membrane protein
MIQKYLLLFSFLIFLSKYSVAQEYHWTMYNMSPLSVNPAKTGDYYGTFRVGGIYRSQFQAQAVQGFSTPMIYIDAPLIKGFREQDWVGVGVMLWQDRAGQLGLQNTGIYISAAYHLALNKKGNSYLSVGFQTGSISRRIDVLDPELQIFQDELIMGGMSPDRDRIMTDGQSATEYAGGVQLKLPFGDRTNFIAGVRVGHLNNNMNLSIAGGGDQLPTRITGNLQLDFLVAPGIIISPSALYESFDPASEMLTQVQARFLVDEEKEIEVSGGLGYRFGDAAQVLLGVQVGNIKVGTAFDFTTSDLSRSSAFGGFEIGASYIAKIYKKPKVDPVIFCPRF